MRTHSSCLVALLCCFAMTVLGCQSEIGEVSIAMVPDHGCVPLKVKLTGKAETPADVSGTFRWTIGKGEQLHGPRVTHTFERSGTYDITLTVVGEKQTKTRVATIQVSEAALPRFPGLYLQQGCAYQAIKKVEEKKLVKRLGKTSLQDLQQRIVGRDLSTRELVTHPLWRREHTHTVYMVHRDQFVDIPLEHFQALGFVAVGEGEDVGFGDISLFRILPSPEPVLGQQEQVVTRMVDSWGLDNVAPESLSLIRTRIAGNVMRYVPDGQLTAGLYFMMDVQSEDKGTPGINLVALVASHN
jgi:PKD repeat protein